MGSHNSHHAADDSALPTAAAAAAPTRPVPLDTSGRAATAESVHSQPTTPTGAATATATGSGSDFARPVLSVSTEAAPSSSSITAPYTLPARSFNAGGAGTFSALHSFSASTLPRSISGHPASLMPPSGSHRMPLRSFSTATPQHYSQQLSSAALSSVSNAIHSHLHPPAAAASLQLPLQPTPQTPSLLTSDTQEQKKILLHCLFQAIDRDSNSYLEREELVTWVEHEPWLQQENLSRRAQKLLEAVNHDEDSRCSKVEFLHSFEHFTTPDIIMLVVNLLRAGMVCKLPRVTFVYNHSDFYMNGLFLNDHNGAGNGSHGSPEESPDPGEHGDLSVSDTPAHSLMFGPHKEEASKHFFLVEVLFEAMVRCLAHAFVFAGTLSPRALHKLICVASPVVVFDCACCDPGSRFGWSDRHQGSVSLVAR